MCSTLTERVSDSGLTVDQLLIKDNTINNDSLGIIVGGLEAPIEWDPTTLTPLTASSTGPTSYFQQMYCTTSTVKNGAIVGSGVGLRFSHDGTTGARSANVRSLDLTGNYASCVGLGFGVSQLCSRLLCQRLLAPRSQ